MEYCAKHDKVFRENEKCFGCETEKQILGPDDTLAELGKMRHVPEEDEKKNPEES